MPSDVLSSSHFFSSIWEQNDMAVLLDVLGIFTGLARSGLFGEVSTTVAPHRSNTNISHSPPAPPWGGFPPTHPQQPFHPAAASDLLGATNFSSAMLRFSSLSTVYEWSDRSHWPMHIWSYTSGYSLTNSQGCRNTRVENHNHMHVARKEDLLMKLERPPNCPLHIPGILAKKTQADGFSVHPPVLAECPMFSPTSRSCFGPETAAWRLEVGPSTINHRFPDPRVFFLQRDCECRWSRPWAKQEIGRAPQDKEDIEALRHVPEQVCPLEQVGTTCEQCAYKRKCRGFCVYTCASRNRQTFTTAFALVSHIVFFYSKESESRNDRSALVGKSLRRQPLEVQGA